MLHGGPVKSLVEFSDAFSNKEVSKLTADDLHQTFSVCRKLINDPRVDVQRYGALCFFNVQRARFDTDPFVGPYLADLEKLVADRSTLVTHLLIVIMTQQSEIPTRTSEFLLAHLQVVNRTKDETIEDETIATLGGLIAAHSKPMTSKVIEYIKASDSIGIQGTIIQALGVNRVTDPEFLEYIKSVLEDPDSQLHWNAIEAVDRLPMEVRKTFGADILRLSVEPNEPENVKEIAKAFLKHQGQ